MIDITSLGELLIDFTGHSTSDSGMRLFERNPGGAVANVACAAARLGLSTAFIGKVGDDMHGHFLRSVLQAEGVDNCNLIVDPAYPTTLAFVALEQGESTFSFFRKHTADINLCPKEVNTRLIEHSKILHIGTLSTTDEPSRSATMHAIKIARQASVTVSCDVNFRLSLWKSEQEMISSAETLFPWVDMLKISNDEATLLTGYDEPEYASAILMQKYPLSVIAVTCGEKGAIIRTIKGTTEVKAIKAKMVDTTGAGDSFWAAFLYKYIKSGVQIVEITTKQTHEFAAFAAAAASLCVENRGAIPAMPYLNEVESRLGY